MNETADMPRKAKISRAIGVSLKEIRQDQNLTAKELSDLSGISAGMISRIENGLVSPSISSLEALALALQTSIISLFREAHSGHTDCTLVRNGEGIKSTRMAGNHYHEFVNLALHSRKELRFQARRVELERDRGHPPTYVGQGVVFVQVLQGEAIYRYGQQQFTLATGDSISVDAELSHGFIEVLTPKFVFLTVQAERP